jgi:hypothetical protein
MGAAASFAGETAQEFKNFKKIRDEYEVSVDVLTVNLTFLQATWLSGCWLAGYSLSLEL